MKTDIHPKYEKSTITCACGEVIETRSTKPEMRIEICSKCHPIFTGKQKIIDTEGRVDRFKAMFSASQEKQAVKKDKKQRARKQTAAHDIKQIYAQQEVDKQKKVAEKQKKEAERLAKEMETVKIKKVKANKEEGISKELKKTTGKTAKKVKKADQAN